MVLPTLLSGVMMSSQVEITNIGLIALGVEPITTIDEATKGARYAKTLFPVIRKKILRSHPWNIATKRAVLAASTTVPLYEFTLQYQLPSDCLRLLDVYNNTAWKLEGDKILTDYGAPQYIKYIYDNTDYGLYDSSLVDVMGAALAVELCMPMMNDANQKLVLEKVLKLKLSEARSIDARSGSSLEAIEADTYTMGRM